MLPGNFNQSLSVHRITQSENHYLFHQEKNLFFIAARLVTSHLSTDFPPSAKFIPKHIDQCHSPITILIHFRAPIQRFVLAGLISEQRSLCLFLLRGLHWASAGEFVNKGGKYWIVIVITMNSWVMMNGRRKAERTNKPWSDSGVWQSEARASFEWRCD